MKQMPEPQLGDHIRIGNSHHVVSSARGVVFEVEKINKRVIGGTVIHDPGKWRGEIINHRFESAYDEIIERNIATNQEALYLLSGEDKL